MQSNGEVSRQSKASSGSCEPKEREEETRKTLSVPNTVLVGYVDQETSMWKHFLGCSDKASGEFSEKRLFCCQDNFEDTIWGSSQEVIGWTCLLCKTINTSTEKRENKTLFIAFWINVFCCCQACSWPSLFQSQGQQVLDSWRMRETERLFCAITIWHRSAVIH